MNYLDTPTEKYWGCDIETDGLDATKIHVVCCVNAVTGKELHFTEAQPLIDFIKDDMIFVGHNIIGFDAYWLEKLWSVKLPHVIDTLVLSQLFDPNLPKPAGLSNKKGTHSLEAYGVRFKDSKIEFSDFSQYSEEMLRYCYQDVRLTLRVYTNLIRKLSELNFSEKSVELEHLVVPIIQQQRRNGFEFDVSRANQLLQELRDKQRTLETDIAKVFKPRRKHVGLYLHSTRKDGTPTVAFLRHKDRYSIEQRSDGSYDAYEDVPFNIGSPAQRTERLIELGYEPTLFTPTGLPKVDEDALVEFAKVSGIKEAEYIAEWLVLGGRANSIDNWLSLVHKDNKIRGTVFTCGAQSRRMKHSAPNTANISGNDKPYGKEARALWKARDGRVLVGVDAAGLEGRMLLHHLNSKEAWDFFIVNDPHQANSDALKAAGFDISRKAGKNYFYGYCYGAGDLKIASMYGSSNPKVGRKIKDVLGQSVPGLGELIEKLQYEWEENNGLMKCIDGGYVRCPSKSAALNYKLQPDGAIAMKQALIMADHDLVEAKLDYLMVGNIHDEIQMDCDPNDAPDIGRLCVDAIRKAGEVLNFRVPLTGEYVIGKNWSESH